MKPKLLVIEMRTTLENPPEAGLKFVLFRIKKEGKLLGFDYGFANWTGKEWEEVDPSATVTMWGTMPNPGVLL